MKSIIIVNAFSELVGFTDKDKLDILEEARYEFFVVHKGAGTGVVLMLAALLIAITFSILPPLIFEPTLFIKTLSSGVGLMFAGLVYRNLYARMLRGSVLKVLERRS